jgi:DNA polymerase III psi subunit
MTVYKVRPIMTPPSEMTPEQLVASLDALLAEVLRRLMTETSSSCCLDEDCCPRLNPYVATCGQWFATYEEMARHHHTHHADQVRP